MRIYNDLSQLIFLSEMPQSISYDVTNLAQMFDNYRFSSTTAMRFHTDRLQPFTKPKNFFFIFEMKQNNEEHKNIYKWRCLPP